MMNAVQFSGMTYSKALGRKALIKKVGHDQFYPNLRGPNPLNLVAKKQSGLVGQSAQFIKLDAEDASRFLKEQYELDIPADTWIDMHMGSEFKGLKTKHLKVGNGETFETVLSGEGLLETVADIRSHIGAGAAEDRLPAADSLFKRMKAFYQSAQQTNRKP